MLDQVWQYDAKFVNMELHLFLLHLFQLRVRILKLHGNCLHKQNYLVLNMFLKNNCGFKRAPWLKETYYSGNWRIQCSLK